MSDEDDLEVDLTGFTVHDVDFSEAHPLDHACGGLWCWTRPGGPARHARLWWEYVAWPGVRAKLLCARDRHRWCRGWWRTSRPGEPVEGRQGWLCRDCGAVREREESGDGS